MKYLSQKSEITKNKTRDKLHSSPRSHSNIWLEKFPATIAAVSQEIHICLHPCNSANQEDKKWVMFLYSLYVLQFVAKIKHSKWIENSSYVQQRCPSRIPSRLRAISGKKKNPTIKCMKKPFQTQTTEHLHFSAQGTAWLWRCKHPLLPQTARDSGREQSLHSPHGSLALSGKTSLVLSSHLRNKLCADQQEKQWSTHQPLHLFSPVFCIRYPRLKHIICSKIAAWRCIQSSSSYFVSPFPEHEIPRSSFKHNLSCSILACALPRIRMRQPRCVPDLSMLETPQLTPQDLTLLHRADQHKASASLGSQNRFHRISATLHSASLACPSSPLRSRANYCGCNMADKVIVSCCSGAILVDTSLRLSTAHYIRYSEWNEK